MIFSLSLLPSLRRQLMTSSKLMQQQFAQRPASTGFRTFNQPQAEAPMETVLEEYESEVAAPMNRFNRMGARPTATAAPTSAASIDMNKPGINPFTEELAQDYGSANLFTGASEKPFPAETVEVLQAELSPEEIEIKPDGALYLPENRYRKILCKAFGPGGWCLIPRGAHTLNSGILSREYALFAGGRFISQARGHAAVMGFSNPALASEVVRSNALMRVCKDLGVGNEMWDPTFVANWRANYATRRTENGRVRWVKHSAA